MATCVRLAQAEVTCVPLCVLSSDFQEAFDRISHQYLFTILRSYGFRDWFVERIKSMYEEAASSIQINGHISGPIPFTAQLYKDASWACCSLPYVWTHLGTENAGYPDWKASPKDSGGGIR